jgi:hypothetical protein
VKYSILSILFLFVFKIRGLSQNYRPLPGAGAAWQLVTYSSFSPAFNMFDYYYLEVPLINPDTSIQTNVYHKLIEYSYNFPTGNYIGGFRSDSTGKTWWSPSGDSTEYLLIDLNVQPGDTVENVYSYDEWGQAGLTDFCVDSVGVIYFDGAAHKKVYVRPAQSNLGNLWLEALGSFNGFLNRSLMYGLTIEFDNYICISFDDTVRYTGDSIYLDPFNFRYWPDSFQTSAGTCPLYFMLFQGQNENEMVSLRIYPNPATRTFTIEPATNTPSTLRIYTLTGQFLRTQRTQGRTEINVSDLPEGIYLLELETPGGVARQKIILND